MAAEQREIVFETTLQKLLDGRGLEGSRKKLARAIGVNDATISHYLRRRIRPKFETLVAIADYFNVSLDYLVFGERPRVAVNDDPAGLRAQIRLAVVEASDLSGRHLDMFTRISRSLQSTIEETARKVLAQSGDSDTPVGFVTDAEAIGMEACITRMRIMTRLFQSDVNGDQPGAFFEVVTANLKRGRPYEYLLYGDHATWREPVDRFRKLVLAGGVPGDVMQANLHFRALPEELISSVCILDLDLSEIARQEPILMERHRDNIVDGAWAYLSIERSDAQGGVTIEPLYLQSALRQFHRHWTRAKIL